MSHLQKFYGRSRGGKLVLYIFYTLTRAHLANDVFETT